MTLRIIECDQRSALWFESRRGLVTASAFADVLAKGEGKTRRAYMLKLAGERLSGEPMESFESAAMIRGREQEDAARELYAFLQDEALTRVGFMRDDELAGGVGCSPDSLIGTVGLLEIKSAAAHVLVEYVLKNDFPPSHVAQCQGGLWVSQRDWIEIAIYHPKMALFRKKTGRDEAFIKKLASEVERFNEELAAMVEQVRRYGSSTLRGDLAKSLEAA